MPKNVSPNLTIDENVQKFLISTTSRFIGEFVEFDTVIRHAWPNSQDMLGKIRMAEGPLSRSGYVLAFETEPYEKAPGVIVPTYDHVTNTICTYLSVLYGKRFDNHGALEWSGMCMLPDLDAFTKASRTDLPWNTHKPRVDIPIELNLAKFSMLYSFIKDEQQDQKAFTAFNGAARFYMRALQYNEQDPEMSYLHLITAGEIISNSVPFDSERLLDDDIINALKRIEGELTGGDKISRMIRGRMGQIKKRFIETIMSYTDQSFFLRTEASQNMGAFKAESFREVLAAAYDLRSHYVHSGVSFGHWISPSNNRFCAEVQIGQPFVSDKELGKILGRAPTFIGLERVIRYLLLKFCYRFGIDLSNIGDK